MQNVFALFLDSGFGISRDTENDTYCVGTGVQAPNKFAELLNRAPQIGPLADVLLELVGQNH